MFLLNPSTYNGFASLPCLMTPEGIWNGWPHQKYSTPPWNLPMRINPGPCWNTFSSHPTRICPHWGVRSGYALWVPAFFPENSRIKMPFCDVHVHFDCAGWHKVIIPVWLGLVFRGRRSTLKTSTNPSAMCMCVAQARTELGYALWGASFLL